MAAIAFDLATLAVVHPVIECIAHAGGRPLIVGGAVRDAVLGIESSDADIEAHGIAIDALVAALEQLGDVNVVGKSFGVLKVAVGGDTVDVSVPRRENAIGIGHRDFEAILEDMTPMEAAARRDFTMNALAYDPLSGQILDYFDGLAHLRSHVLVHTSEAFREDPLRVLRGFRFCARFRLHAAPSTETVCRDMLPSAHSLPVERIWQEWKGWTVSDAPSFGLRFLQHVNWLRLYPDLALLRDCEQDSEWHPEGSAWDHTLQVCDEAARLGKELPERDRVILVLAALCHDLGKPATTVLRDGHVRSPGHHEVGASIALRFLEQIGAPADIISSVLPLVREHMVHVFVSPSRRLVRRLARRLLPASMALWGLVVEADASGRAPLPRSNPATSWMELAQEESVVSGGPAKILMGRHLLDLGVEPGPRMGEILRDAYEAQLDCEFSDLDGAKTWLHRKVG